MPDGPEPGWYKSADGTDSYWDGRNWHTRVKHETPQPAPTHTSDPDVAVAMESEDRDQAGAPAPAKKRRRALVLTIAIAIVLICVAGAAVYWFFGRQDANAWAMEVCQSEVTDMLKSPKTAEYSDVSVYPLEERYYLFPTLLFTGFLEADEIDIEDAVDALELDREEYNGQAATWLESQPGRDVRIVTGTVNSQNGFGATVESDFVCLYDYPEGGEQTMRVVAFDNKFIDSDWALRFMKPIGPTNDTAS